MASRDELVTCTSCVNIAVIKYWGKRDEALNLPINGSISGTLSQKDIKTTTTVLVSKKFTEDRLWLNGKEEDITNPRIQKCLKQIRSRATKHNADHHVHIVSINNFPTAAGLASSASGYACLVFALAQVYGVEGDISTIARMGSGSACRSLYGGWVKWEMGTREDGEDSRAIQIRDEHHWPEIEVLVLVANDQKKDTSSTDGMQDSVKTSKLIKVRAETIVPERMVAMENAIINKDFQTFGDLTMKDSDNFHAVCADTQPPIYYLKPVSKAVINVVNAFNEYHGIIKAAYTFDAGPNAVIYLPKENIVPLLAVILHFFPPTKTPKEKFIANATLLKQAEEYPVPAALLRLVEEKETPLHVPAPDSLKYVLHTQLGSGPQVVHDPSASLIDASTGLPNARAKM